MMPPDQPLLVYSRAWIDSLMNRAVIRDDHKGKHNSFSAELNIELASWLNGGDGTITIHVTGYGHDHQSAVEAMRPNLINLIRQLEPAGSPYAI